MEIRDLFTELSSRKGRLHLDKLIFLNVKCLYALKHSEMHLLPSYRFHFLRLTFSAVTLPL